MKPLKLRIKIEDGKVGVPITSLSKINEKLRDFLVSVQETYLAETIAPEEWIAVNFGNHSVEYDLERAFPEEVYNLIGNEIVSAVDFEPQGEDFDKRRFGFYKEWIDAGNSLVSRTGKLTLSVYKNGNIDRDKTRVLTKASAQESIDRIKVFERQLEEGQTKYYGGVEGIIKQLTKEAREPYIEIQENNSGVVVRCYYQDHHYNDIVRLLEHRENVVCVSGMITQNKKDPKKFSIEAEHFVVVNDDKFYQEGDLEKFFGAARGLGEGLSARELIDRNRRGQDPP